MSLLAGDSTPLSFFKFQILNNMYEGIDGLDGGTSRMQCFNEEDYSDPAFTKRIICWRNDTWHGLAGINRAVPVEIRVDPDVSTMRFVTSNTPPKRLLVWEANWAITCLNCDPAIPTINVDTRYEYNTATGRLDEILVRNADTGATITRRPIKFKATTK